MRKIITLVSFYLVMSLTISAQIKRTNVLLNKTNVKKQVQGVKVDISKFNKAADFNRINIPESQISKTKLNAKPINTWKITPLKPKNAQLELKSLFGVVTPSYWQTGIETQTNDSDFTNLNPSFPISIKFRASGGVDYRLKLKNLITNRNGYVYIAIGDLYNHHSFVNKIQFDRNNELNYSFYEEKSKDIIIYVSFLSTNLPGTKANYKCLKFSEIVISRIPKS